MPVEATEEQIDRAHESVVTNHPNAEDEVYSDYFAEALADIMAIDAAADRREKELDHHAV
jgi:hypothetical protein